MYERVEQLIEQLYDLDELSEKALLQAGLGLFQIPMLLERLTQLEWLRCEYTIHCPVDDYIFTVPKEQLEVTCPRCENPIPYYRYGERKYYPNKEVLGELLAEETVDLPTYLEEQDGNVFNLEDWGF